MSEKESAPVEAAKVALYGTIIMAVIGVITAVVTSYSTYMSNRVQVELPITATQTAEARSVAETQTASPSISVSTKSFASVIVQKLVNRNLLSTNSGAVVWEEKEAIVLIDKLDSAGSISTNSAPTDFVFFSNVAWDSDDKEFTACGFNFRSDNLGSNYMSLLRRNGNAVLWLMTPSNNKNISSVSIEGINRANNEANNLLLIVEGASFTFLINDTVVYNGSDATLKTGFVGKAVGAGSDDFNKCTFKDSWLWAIK